MLTITGQLFDGRDAEIKWTPTTGLHGDPAAIDQIHAAIRAGILVRDTGTHTEAPAAITGDPAIVLATIKSVFADVTALDGYDTLAPTIPEDAIA